MNKYGIEETRKQFALFYDKHTFGVFLIRDSNGNLIGLYEGEYGDIVDFAVTLDEFVPDGFIDKVRITPIQEILAQSRSRLIEEKAKLLEKLDLINEKLK